MQLRLRKSTKEMLLFNQLLQINRPEPSDSIPGFEDSCPKSDDKQDRTDSSLNKKVQS
jgi:hypothetical protein